MLSLASPRPTWAHKLPAALKFGLLAVAMILAMRFAALPVQAGALGATLALYVSLGREAMRAGLRALRPLWWIIAVIVLWQGYEGTWELGLAFGLRVLVMVGLANFVTLTTPMPEIIALIERLARPLSLFGLSPRLPALAVALVLRLVPVLLQRQEALASAWRARSARRPGPRLIAPLAFSLLDDADHLADALRARGGVAPRSTGRN